ncbi:unnamed protein product, partial [Sphacelaria rigidula]
MGVALLASDTLLSLLVDSGTTDNFVDNFLNPGLLETFPDYTILLNPFQITAAGGHVLNAIASVTVLGKVTDQHGVSHEVSLPSYVVPGLGRHLFSVKNAVTRGINVVFDPANPRLEVASFQLPLKQSLHDHGETTNTVAMLTTADAELWHRRLGHVSSKTLRTIQGIDGNGVIFTGNLSSCDTCALSKSKQQAHPKTAVYKVCRPYELIIGDMMGPITSEAIGGFKYIRKLTDFLTRSKYVYLTQSKGDALKIFQTFIQTEVIPREARVKRLRADKGGECTGNEFHTYCSNSGVRIEFAATNTPQQIGVSDRDGGTLAAMSRCLLADSGLPSFLWGELAYMAAYLMNRVPHSALNMESPFKRLNGVEPELSHLRVIGARAFVHIEVQTKK